MRIWPNTPPRCAAARGSVIGNVKKSRFAAEKNKKMKLDILAIAVHPDDVELGCSGTLLMEKANGKKTGVIDLTRGELGTRGTPELRAEEAARAAEILGVDVRENLGMADGFFQNDEEHQRLLIRAIRKYRPEIVLGNALEDRH